MKKASISLIILTIFALVIGIAGCSSSKSTSSADTSGAEKTASADNTTGDTQQTGVGEKGSEQQVKQVFAVIETNKGKIVIQLFPHKAPKTVDNFIKLANAHFYDGIKWHRVEPGFVIQGGDPLSRDSNPDNDGLGNPGYTIKAEISDVPHLRGTVAMAHNSKDINSGGSQFYICLNDEPQLDGQYAVFGKVTEGMDVVDKIQVYDVMSKVSIEEK